MDDSDREMIRKTFDDLLEEKLPTIVKKVLEAEKSSERKFVILMDFENFKRGLTIEDEFLDISWLTNPISEVDGKIILAMLFLPEYMRVYPPIKVLSNLHHFFPVFCPSTAKPDRDKDDYGVGTRDTDTVDSRIDEFGNFAINHCPGVTDILIIGGDGGYQKLLKYGENNRRKVWIFSARDALSMRFDLQRSNPNIRVETVLK